MPHQRSILRALRCSAAAAIASAAAEPLAEGPVRQQPLDSGWHFFIDPMNAGVTNGWHLPPDGWDGSEPIQHKGWDPVALPHNWTLDPRFPYYGRAWYRTSVHIGTRDADQRWSLRFGPVYHRCRVFINGTEAGAHEGGFTPFEIDITRAVAPGRHNMIAVEVDNSWSTQTLPGARPGGQPADQVFPWWPSGGLVGGVSLWSGPPITIEDHRITSDIRFDDASVTLTVSAQIINQITIQITSQITSRITGDQSEPSPLTVELTIHDPLRADQPMLSATRSLDPASPGEVSASWTVPLEQIRLWDLDRPELYDCTVRVLDGANQLAADRERFGVRSFAIDGVRILLNNEPVRLGGANRAFDHPRAGTVDPPSVVAEDGELLERASMELSRLQHQPLSKAMLRWADEHGLLIIQEANAWQLTASQLADPAMQARYKRELRETVAMSRNHPCVIGWSVGNEYESWTPEGVAWTREMKRYLREELGITLPIMNAEHARAWGHVRELAAEAPSLDQVDRSLSSLDHQDILCVNWYGSAAGLASNLDLITALWPGRPVLITEFGLRADESTPERRERHLRSFTELARSRPEIVGLSYWSFNDYRSMYPGTNPDGTRPWGIVRYDRSERPLFAVAQQEFCPLALRWDADAILLMGRETFPARTVRNATLELIDSEGRAVSRTRIDAIQPGQVLRIDAHADAAAARILSSTGAEILPPVQR